MDGSVKDIHELEIVGAVAPSESEQVQAEENDAAKPLAEREAGAARVNSTTSNYNDGLVYRLINLDKNLIKINAFNFKIKDMFQVG